MKRVLFFLPALVWLATSCASTSGKVAGVQDITGGIGIVVDASTVHNNTVSRNEFSIIENRAIAARVAKVAADALERKGYAPAGVVVTTAGGRLNAKAQYSVTDAEGKELKAPEEVQPPFVIEPPVADAARPHIAPLFSSLRAKLGSMGEPGDKELPSIDQSYLDAAPDGGAVLAIVCEGHVPSGGARAAAVSTALLSIVAATSGGSGKIEGEVRTQSNAEIYIIDRRSGVTLWHDSVEEHDLSPAFFADAVGKTLEKLPQAGSAK